MSVHLYVAPAGAGKTTFVLQQARERAMRWEQTRVVVGSGRQMLAAHRQLARQKGSTQKGTMGVRVQTLFALARDVLDRSGASLTLISDPIQVRFLRSLVDEAGLTYYAPLARMPGFIRALRRLFAELTNNLITPGDFEQSVVAMGESRRLMELARLYAMYRQRMDAENWVDQASLLTRAREAVVTSPEIIGQWDFLGIDGFMRLTPAGLALLQSASHHLAGTTLITLTGDLAGGWTPGISDPFADTIARFEQAFGLTAEPLPESASSAPRSVLSRRADQLFQPDLHWPDAANTMTFVAAPDIAGEARVALRWIKERLALDKLSPTRVAILARDISPYRDSIVQIAREFGLPVRVAGGFSVRSNPAVDALISLLNLATPEYDPTSDEPDYRFPFRTTVAAWRSPYFDWHWTGEDGDITIQPQDADVLDALGRWARVTAGVEQWEEALARAVARHRLEDEEPEVDGEEPAARPPALVQAEALQRKWLRFRAAVTPPAGEQPVRAFVRWLEDLIGPEPDDEEAVGSGFSLQMIARIRADADENLKERDIVALRDRDIAAMRGLKEVLRGMVWAADALALPDTTFDDFLVDLSGALEAAHYEPRQRSGQGFVMAMGVREAAGLRFDAVALLGLAEGAFPAVLREDTFLRGDDRERLQTLGVPVDPALRSEEAALFYLAMSRAEKQMLMTRPRLAQGGADWQASPYWQTVVDAAGIKPDEKRHETMLEEAFPASWPELMQGLAAYPGNPHRDAMETAAGGRLDDWRHGYRIVKGRTLHRKDIFDGDFSGLPLGFARRFGPDYVWSASRLETYRNCPYQFFASAVLHLEERAEPVLGLDARQLGMIYHEALEEIFRLGADDAANADALMTIWEGIADDLLDAAPAKYEFRPTAWWPQTREQIKETVRRTLGPLAEVSEGWRTIDFEAAFGREGRAPLISPREESPDDALRLRGIIDRVDHNDDGDIRIIDYKTGSVSKYGAKDFERGDFLQLPLYALAASQVLERGQTSDGFYWSVRTAKVSPLQLGKYGVEEAIATALAHAWKAVDGARSGAFHPQPPKSGCSDYCPAAAFCWHYRSGWG